MLGEIRKNFVTHLRENSINEAPPKGPIQGKKLKVLEDARLQEAVFLGCKLWIRSTNWRWYVTLYFYKIKMSRWRISGKIVNLSVIWVEMPKCDIANTNVWESCRMRKGCLALCGVRFDNGCIFCLAFLASFWNLQWTILLPPLQNYSLS